MTNGNERLGARLAPDGLNYHIPYAKSDRSDFDGPLDLLLSLIKENQANIYDIPVAEIADEYVSWMKSHEVAPERLADFYAMAARLLYIKSRLLLPTETEEDDEFEDPRAELVDELIEYQRLRRLTELLSGRAEGERLFISRPESDFTIPFEDHELFNEITLESLRTAFSSLLSTLPKTMIFNIFEEVSDKEKKVLMMELLEKNSRTTLDEVIGDKSNPLNIICAFMAMLDAMKERSIIIRQAYPYGRIDIKLRPIDWDTSEKREESIINIGENNETLADDISILSGEASLSVEDLAEMKRAEMEADAERYRPPVELGEEEEVRLDDDL